MQSAFHPLEKIWDSGADVSSGRNFFYWQAAQTLRGFLWQVGIAYHVFACPSSVYGRLVAGPKRTTQ